MHISKVLLALAALVNIGKAIYCTLPGVSMIPQATEVSFYDLISFLLIPLISKTYKFILFVWVLKKMGGNGIANSFFIDYLIQRS